MPCAALAGSGTRPLAASNAGAGVGRGWGRRGERLTVQPEPWGRTKGAGLFNLEKQRQRGDVTELLRGCTRGEVLKSKRRRHEAAHVASAVLFTKSDGTTPFGVVNWRAVQRGCPKCPEHSREDQHEQQMGAFRSFSAKLQQPGLKVAPKKSAREKQRDFVSLGKAPLPAARSPGTGQASCGAAGAQLLPSMVQGPTRMLRAALLTPNPGKSPKGADNPRGAARRGAGTQMNNTV